MRDFTEQEVRELMVLARMFPKRNVGELIAERSQSIPGRLCNQCDADEFHRSGEDWVCSNGHVQTWTIMSPADHRQLYPNLYGT